MRVQGGIEALGNGVSVSAVGLSKSFFSLEILGKDPTKTPQERFSKRRSNSEIHTAVCPLCFFHPSVRSAKAAGVSGPAGWGRVSW